MRLRFGLVAVALCAGSLALLPACGRKTRERAHAAGAEAPLPAPTPDTTPVDALRTPAGFALKANPPSGTPSPQASPSGGAAKSP